MGSYDTHRPGVGGTPAATTPAPAAATKFVSLTDTPAGIPVGEELVGNAAGDALEFIRRSFAPGGLEIVSVVPPTFQGYILNLKHPAHVETGRTQDRILVGAYNVATGFYGYSDGSSYPKTGTISDPQTSRLISWIGSESGTRAGITLGTWEADYIASHSRSWLSGFNKIWLAGNVYDLSGAEVYNGGVWLKGIINGPNRLGSGNVTFNLVETNSNVYFREDRVINSTGGILWWNGRKYVLLGVNAMRYAGVYDNMGVYYRGDLVTASAGGSYLCIAEVASQVALTDTDLNDDLYFIPISVASTSTSPTVVARPSIVDITGQGGHPQIVAKNKDRLYADFSIPRIWMPHRIPIADTPATGESVLWPIAGKYAGTHDYFPAGVADGDIAYSRREHTWQRRISAATSQTFSLVEITKNKTDFPGTFVWLGERPDANDAAAHVPATYTTLVNFSYLFYNETTRVVEKLSAYVAPASPGERYTPSRLLSYADWLEVQSVKPTIGNPLVDEQSQYEIAVDPSVPRAWIGQRIPLAGVPAKGTSAALAIGSVFLGSFDEDPPNPHLGPPTNIFGESSFGPNVTIVQRNNYGVQNASWLSAYNADPELVIKIVSSAGTSYQRRNVAGTAWEVVPASDFLTVGQIYYNSSLHYWSRFYDGIVSTGVWTHTVVLFAFRSFSNTTYWLGERASAVEAAAHVAQPTDSTGRYIFYNTTSRVVEQLVTAGIVAATSARIQYRPIPLQTAVDSPETLRDTITNPRTINGLSTNVTVAFSFNVTGQNKWRRNVGGGTRAADGAYTYPNKANQLAFSRQLTPLDDNKLLSIELRWEEVNSNTAANITETNVRLFMTTISAMAFRLMIERQYAGSGNNSGTVKDSADWYVRRPNSNGNDVYAWGEMCIKYSRFRAAYVAPTNLVGDANAGKPDDSAAARAVAPDGLALAFGAGAQRPNNTYMRNLQGRIRLHG